MHHNRFSPISNLGLKYMHILYPISYINNTLPYIHSCKESYNDKTCLSVTIRLDSSCACVILLPGIFFGNGESWKELRRFSLRTLRDFGFGKQKSQETFIEEELDHLMKRMDEMRSEAATQASAAEKDVVCMKKFFSVSALNIIWSLIAGFRFHHDDKQLQKLVQLMSEIVRLLAVGEDIIAAYPVLRHVLPRFTKRGQERKKFLNEIHGMFKVRTTLTIHYNFL